MTNMIEFFSKKLAFLLMCGVLLGLAMFAVEVAFSISLQDFLVTLGVLNVSVSSKFSFRGTQSSLGFALGVLFCVGSVRALCQWFQVQIQAVSINLFQLLSRNRLIRWAFHSQLVSSATVVTLFHDRVAQGGVLVWNIQALIVQLTTATALLISLFFIHGFSTMIVLVLAGVLLFFMKFLDRRVRATAEQLNVEVKWLNQNILMSIKNIILIQLYGMQSFEEKKIQKSLLTFYHQNIYTYKLTGLSFVLPQILGITLICMLSLIWRSLGGMNPAELVVYFYLFVRFTQSFSQVLQTYSSVQLSYPGLRELYLWWKEHNPKTELYFSETTVPEQRQDENLEKKAPEWLLEKVSYRYDPRSQNVIEDFNLQIRAGETAVIVGPSGVGKSTLLGLILGYLKPNQGSVKVRTTANFQELKDVRHQILAGVGYVGPESFIIEGTVHENLIYGLKTPPTMDDIRATLELAECSFVYQLPQGLDHVLSEQGQGLSAGQKQRLSLARALLRKPTMLVLDEATSNLDIETERKLLQTLKRFKGRMTMIVVTHRETLLELADQKITLNNSASVPNGPSSEGSCSLAKLAP